MIQTIIDGLILGGILSLAAVGFSLIFGVMNVVNLTHGVMVLLGAYLAWAAWQGLGVDPLLTIPAIMLILFAFGYAYQRFIIQHAVERSTLLASLLVTFGVALMMRNALVLIFSPDIKSISPDYAFTFFRIGPVTVDLVRLIGLGLSLVLIGALSLLLNATRFGRVVRATAQQEMAARLCAVDVRHVFALTFGIAAAFAGAAGVIIGMVLPFAPPNEVEWTIYAFIVVVLGGIGSAGGALLGGMLLGLINTFTAQYIGPSFTNAMMFLVLVLMLLVRPNGILGNAFGGSR